MSNQASARRRCLAILEASPKPLTFRQLARKVGLPVHLVVATAFMVEKALPSGAERKEQ